MDSDLIGFIHFDKPNIKSIRVEALVIKEKSSKLLRNKFIKIINSQADEQRKRKEFIGRILEGPFFQPEEVTRESALAQVSILRGEEFPVPPNFYATVIIEIIGELFGSFIYSTSSRPSPQSKVVELGEDDLNAILGLKDGNFLVGHLEGYPKVHIKFDSRKISVLPRNIGIFGTVGSGKTNTAQVLIEELAEREKDLKEKWAVVILDVEGEYTMMNKPEEVEDKHLRKLREIFGIEPKGIDDFYVLKLCNHESTIDTAEDVTINIDQIDEYMLGEILQTTEPQSAALFSIIDQLKKHPKKEELDPERIIPKTTKKSGYTLNDIISEIDNIIVKQRRSKKDKDNESEENKVNEILVRAQSLIPLKRKLLELVRTKAFDVKTASSIDPSKYLVPGRVTVFDLSYTGDYEKNLLIAQLLERVFKAKRDDATLPKTLIMIEEAHTFVSRENKDRMIQTIRKLKEIARRGRKRWLSLCFISQQPAHLPGEIFELANTRVVHNIRSKNNLEVLKQSSGDVTEEMWDSVPALNPGQAIINSPQFKNSLVVEVRHCRSKRIKQEDIK
ncbi:MAG: ATP-binding protein [Ignavibacteria bacterium]|nr:ATP-binding protein [Ignavibacteria bacterium]